MLSALNTILVQQPHRCQPRPQRYIVELVLGDRGTRFKLKNTLPCIFIPKVVRRFTGARGRRLFKKAGVDMGRLKVGLNGFGRIGRAIYRINHKYDLFDIVAVNDLNPDISNLAYLLRYDSVHGPLADSIIVDGDKLVIRGRTVAIYKSPDIQDVPWRDHGIDVLIDASGSKENASIVANMPDQIGHYVRTNAAKEGEAIKTVIFGGNENQFVPAVDRIISASICDAVALSPLIKLIEDRYGIEAGFLTTLHPWLADQQLLDSAADSSKAMDSTDSHYALGRSAINNLIPKSTTAVLAAQEIFPNLTGKIESFSYRVPTNIVSSAVLNVTLETPTDQESVIEMFHEYEKNQTWKVISNSTEPKVSSDYSGSEHSVSIDHRWTIVKNGRKLRLVYWYDNEWGYSSRVIDILKLIEAARVPQRTLINQA